MKPISLALAACERPASDPARRALLAPSSKRIGLSQRGIEGGVQSNWIKSAVVASPPIATVSRGSILFQRGGQPWSSTCRSAAPDAPEASVTQSAAERPPVRRLRIIFVSFQEACHSILPSLTGVVAAASQALVTVASSLPTAPFSTWFLLCIASASMSSTVERYAGRTAVVTGGTSGVGLATVRLLLDRGAQGLATGRSAKAVDAACAQLGDAPIR